MASDSDALVHESQDQFPWRVFHQTAPLGESRIFAIIIRELNSTTLKHFKQFIRSSDTLTVMQDLLASVITLKIN